VTAEPIDATESTDPQWYKRAVFYELLVRGFADSNADGGNDVADYNSVLPEYG
jgi:maltose alpha-D-glucosyltransferase/alpha-amylase